MKPVATLFVTFVLSQIFPFLLIKTTCLIMAIPLSLQACSVSSLNDIPASAKIDCPIFMMRKVNPECLAPF